MSGRSVVQVTLWNSPYLGNFMSSQLLLASHVRERFGLGTHFVLGDGAQGQPWLTDLEDQGCAWSIVPPERSRWSGHIARVVGDCDAALLHTHFTAADLQCASIASKAGVPCIWHIRTGFTGYSLKQRAKDLVKWRLVARRRVARVITVSAWLGEFVCRRGAPRDRVAVVPNPIVLDRFQEMPDRAQARERFGLDANADVVLALGWWPEVKGVDVFLSAMERLAAQRPSINALLVGNEQMDAYLAEHVPRRPAWLRTSPFVDDAAWLFAAADTFVSASRHEGQSSAVGEAIACGLPVVMSDIVGTATWSLAPCVLTFPSEDATALAAQLEQVLARPPDARAEASSANRSWAHEHAGPGPWRERLATIYEELLEPSMPMPPPDGRRFVAQPARQIRSALVGGTGPPGRRRVRAPLRRA
jgi:glycosyltransferase involved in cell wall biosynthesis